MGATRAEEEGRKLAPYDSHSVCRAYLLECCPREILVDTRLESLVNCRKIHEPAHKADYKTAQAERDHFYDIEVGLILVCPLRACRSNEVTRRRL